MPVLPGLHEGNREQEVSIGVCLSRAVDHHGGGNEVFRRDAVDGVVSEVLAGHPMDRRIEMRPGMLADGEIVPIPGRTALIVARHFFEAERRALTEFRRQSDVWKLRTQGV